MTKCDSMQSVDVKHLIVLLLPCESSEIKEKADLLVQLRGDITWWSEVCLPKA